MRKLGLILFSLASANAIAGDFKQFDNLGVNYERLNADGNQRYEGYGFSISKSLNEHVFVSSSLIKYENNSKYFDDEAERRSLGGGFFYAISKSLVPFYEYQYIDQENSYFESTINMQRNGVGLSGRYAGITYKASYNKYESNEDISENDNSTLFSVSYWINERLAVSVGVEDFSGGDIIDAGIKINI